MENVIKYLELFIDSDDFVFDEFKELDKALAWPKIQYLTRFGYVRNYPCTESDYPYQSSLTDKGEELINLMRSR